MVTLKANYWNKTQRITRYLTAFAFISDDSKEVCVKRNGSEFCSVDWIPAKKFTLEQAL
jgi:hypothetical protein